MKKQINLAEQSITLTFGEQEETFSLHGLTTDTCIYLALEGIAARLKNRKNPMRVWERFKAGKKKKYPATVKALSKINSLDLDQVMEEWKGLSAEQRRKLTRTPEVQIEIQNMKINESN